MREKVYFIDVCCLEPASKKRLEKKKHEKLFSGLGRLEINCAGPQKGQKNCCVFSKIAKNSKLMAAKVKSIDVRSARDCSTEKKKKKKKSCVFR